MAETPAPALAEPAPAPALALEAPAPTTMPLTAPEVRPGGDEETRDPWEPAAGGDEDHSPDPWEQPAAGLLLLAAVAIDHRALVGDSSPTGASRSVQRGRGGGGGRLSSSSSSRPLIPTPATPRAASAAGVPLTRAGTPDRRYRAARELLPEPLLTPTDAPIRVRTQRAPSPDAPAARPAAAVAATGRPSPSLVARCAAAVGRGRAYTTVGSRFVHVGTGVAAGQWLMQGCDYLGAGHTHNYASLAAAESAMIALLASNNLSPSALERRGYTAAAAPAAAQKRVARTPASAATAIADAVVSEGEEVEEEPLLTKRTRR